MLAPKSSLGSRSSYGGGATLNSSAPLGGRLRLLSNQVGHLSAEKAPLELTFGVEVEFMLLGDIPTESHHYHVECAAHTMVYHALCEPVSAPCAECGEDHALRLPVLAPDQRSRYDTSGWQITSDPSVHVARELYDGEQYGMELKSRVFTKGTTFPTTNSATNSLHRHSITTEQEITLVLQRLHDAFNTVEGSRGSRADIRLAVPPTAGLHVHVGNGVMSRGFPLSTVKNLFMLYLANERSIDSVQHTERIGGALYAIMPLSNEYRPHRGDIPGRRPYNVPHSLPFIHRAFALLNDKSHGKRHVPLHKYPVRELHLPQIGRSAYSFEPSDWLNLIQNAMSLDDLRDTHREYEHMNTLNFQNLSDFDPSPSRQNGKVTVEFRQHAGTIEPEEILAWVDIATSMVQFAHVSSPATMRGHLDQVLRDPNFDIFKLLQTLSCEEATEQHYRHVFGLAKVGRNYAGDRHNKQTRNANQIQNEASAVRQHIIDARFDALEHSNVQDKINMKLKMGGYGRFTRTYLDRYKGDLTEADKQRLTAGNIITRVPNVEEILGNGPHSFGDDDSTWSPCDLALTPPHEGEEVQPTVVECSCDGQQHVQPASQRPGSRSDTSLQYAFAPDDIVQPPPSATTESQLPRKPALEPMPSGDLDLPCSGLGLPLPTQPVPFMMPRPLSVMSRRGCVVPTLDVDATEKISRHIRATREAVVGTVID